MKARRLIGGAAFQPDELKVIFDAFDEAWEEIAPDVSVRAKAIEAARFSLATIVLFLGSMIYFLRAAPISSAAVDPVRS